MGTDAATTPEVRVRALARELDARAAGLWRVEGDRLALVAFVPGPGLPAEVAEAFARATRSVGLDQADLGIVRAALDGAVAVSRVDALPSGAGSGRWLRAFGATRSVAVALRGAEGRVVGVLSAALDDAPPEDAAVAARLRDADPFAAGGSGGRA